MMSGGSLIIERLRAFRGRKFARRAGAVVLAIIAIDLAASALTVAIGAEFLKR
jgi:hypothetical protein